MRHLTKRAVTAALVLPLAGASLIGGAAAASAAAPDKVTYCHATHSETNPYVVVTTAKVAVLRAHQNHQDDEDVIPAFDYVLQGQAGFFPGQTVPGVDPVTFVAEGCDVLGPR